MRNKLLNFPPYAKCHFCDLLDTLPDHYPADSSQTLRDPI